MSRNKGTLRAFKNRKMIEIMREKLGCGYSYRKLISLGIKKFLGVQTLRVPSEISPNDLAIGEGLRLLFTI